MSFLRAMQEENLSEKWGGFNMVSKIFHLEDSQQWRNYVSSALGSERGIRLRQFGCLADFYKSPDILADLYILDRHLPFERDGNIDDKNWVRFVKYMADINVNLPIVILSGRAPEDGEWRRFSNVRASIPKQGLAVEDFKYIVFDVLVGGRR